MYEVFGEFNSAEEINKAAEGLKNEGDIENLYKLAEENGIDRSFAEMYVQGAMPFLCDVAMAAAGKIAVEEGELKPKELIADWVEYIKSSCMEDDTLAEAVRKSDKTLKGCLAVILKWSYENRYKVDDKIVELSGIKSKDESLRSIEMGIPGMGTAKKLIKEYYLG